MKVKYIGPFEEIELANHKGTVKRGDEIDVEQPFGESLLDQVDNFEPADKAAEDYLKAKAAEAEKAAQQAAEAAVARELASRGLSDKSTVAELKKYADDNGIELGDATTKPQLIAAITGTDQIKES